jgi:transcriptional regulator with XRE-family HTH domain
MSHPNPCRNHFPKALKTARTANGLNQESFSLVSSRTYVSSLERGLKVPTLNKVDELAEVLTIHPLTLLALSYMTDNDSQTVEELFSLVTKELLNLREKNTVLKVSGEPD